MLDYEIIRYTVYWTKLYYGNTKLCCKGFDTEEEAVVFVKEKRNETWLWYSIEQTRRAIIDF